MLNWSEIEARVTEAMAKATLPGMAMAVLGRGDVVYAKGFGVTSDVPNAPAVEADTVFRVGSVTKSLTAALVMRLAEASTVNLDTPIIEYVPWLRLHDPDAARQITLRMLLAQTSGLPAALDYAGWRDTSGLEAYVRTVLPELPLVAPPGAVYAYSNPGYNLAGFVAEAAAGAPYAELMTRDVFAPLGMTRSTFDPLLAMTWPLSQSFLLDDDGKPYVKRPFVDNTGEYPCGFALSTVEDLAKIVRMHLHDGDTPNGRFLTPESVEAMRTPHAEQLTLDERTYGLGLRQRRYKDMTLVGHNGAISKFGAFAWWQPEAGAGVVMLVNRSAGFWGAGDRLLLSIIDGLLEEAAVTPRRSPAGSGARGAVAAASAGREKDGEITFDAYTGAYLGPNVGLAVVTVVDGKPTMTLNGVDVTLEPVYGRLYQGKRADSRGLVPVGFAGTAEAPVVYVDGSACLRVREPLSKAGADAWVDRLGTYAGETDVWRLRLDSDGLRLYSEDDRMELPALPLDDHRLVSDFGLFEYVDDETPMLVGGGGLWRFYRQPEAS